jgi:hypothetical protein
MYRRLWFDLHATVLHAEHALIRATHGPAQPGRAEPALILRGANGPLLTSNGIPRLRATSPVPARHIDHLDTAGQPEATPDASGTGTYRLPLRTRSPLTGAPLRDVLRRGAHAGDIWFTVDIDPAGLRAVTTRAARDLRDGDDVADGTTWFDATLTAAGLGTYPGQTCTGYRRHSGVLARFQPTVVQRLVADTRCSHSTVDGFFVAEEGDRVWLVDDLGDRAELRTDADGWYRIAHPALAWTATPILADPEPDAVFGYADHPDLDRCRVCGAINEIDYREMPSMVGYGFDTASICAICGSSDSADPMFGLHPNPKPWPPQPEQPTSEPTGKPGHGTGPECGDEPGGSAASA